MADQLFGGALSSYLVILGWLCGSVLVFYLLSFGLARLPILQARPQLLRWIHLGGWGLSLLQLLVFARAGVSLRGQWPDALPFAGAWLAAAGYFLLRRRQLGWAGKFYFGGWFAYPAALAGAYLADRIFFVLVAAPVLVFLPNGVLYEGPECSLRSAAGGLLAPARVALLTPVGWLLEKQHGTIPDEALRTDSIGAITAAQLLPAQHPDTTVVLLSGSKGQSRVQFTR
jgi:hypothetical protein